MEESLLHPNLLATADLIELINEVRINLNLFIIASRYYQQDIDMKILFLATAEL